MISRHASFQDITWFIDLYKTGRINLDPPYQRRSVWSLSDRKLFLDTIFRNYPSPTIYLHKTFTSRNEAIYEVVDGKQRLETIFIFYDDKITLPTTFRDNRLDGKKWSTIQENRDLMVLFWNYTIPVEVVDLDPSTQSVNEAFDRLNRNSKKLNEQELRHARFGGWFATFNESEADDDFWKAIKISTRTKSKRMRDVQFISELSMVIIDKRVHGFDQDNISGFYATYDNPEEDLEDFETADFSAMFRNVKEFVTEMEEYNGCVSEYASEYKNFYSLWSAIALLDDIEDHNAEEIAYRYIEFMSNVASYSEEDGDSRCSDIEISYARNNIGANTDFPQREARLNALRAALFPE